MPQCKSLNKHFYPLNQKWHSHIALILSVCLHTVSHFEFKFVLLEKIKYFLRLKMTSLGTDDQCLCPLLINLIAYVKLCCFSHWEFASFCTEQGHFSLRKTLLSLLHWKDDINWSSALACCLSRYDHELTLWWLRKLFNSLSDSCRLYRQSSY